MVNTHGVVHKILGGVKTDKWSFNNSDPPRPKYNKCNKGHTLVLVEDERTGRKSWDCPTCIHSMKKYRG